jgi:hypothetical protein
MLVLWIFGKQSVHSVRSEVDGCTDSVVFQIVYWPIAEVGRDLSVFKGIAGHSSELYELGLSLS